MASGKKCRYPSLYFISSRFLIWQRYRIFIYRMTAFFKKILVLLPVILLGCFYLSDHYAAYVKHTSAARLLLMGVSFLMLYLWILAEVLLRRQRNAFQVVLQSSFFVYVFMVLTLTGYFILFREISVHHWWSKMLVRFSRRDHVNLELFKIFRIYKLSHTQILGNFIMLMPLGIYFPLLYRRISHFLVLLVAAFLVSFTIELLQLVTSYRSADVDDILLNTAGACFGYILFQLVKFLAQPAQQPSFTAPAAMP